MDKDPETPTERRKKDPQVGRRDHRRKQSCVLECLLGRGLNNTPASLLFCKYITDALRKLLEGGRTENYREQKIKRLRQAAKLIRNTSYFPLGM